MGQSQVASKAPEWLGRIGFSKGEQSKEDIVLQYQQFSGLSPTGKLDSSTATAIRNDLKLLDRIDDSSFQSRRFGTSQESGLLRSCSDCFGHLTDGSLNYQLVRPDAPELWALDQRGVVVTRLKGAGAIAEFHKVGRQIAINNSTDDVLFLYAPHSRSVQMVRSMFRSGHKKLR